MPHGPTLSKLCPYIDNSAVYQQGEIFVHMYTYRSNKLCLLSKMLKSLTWALFTPPILVCLGHVQCFIQ